ncbi:MAG: Na/Pi cotransporter family protein [Christensenellales bacterium]
MLAKGIFYFLAGLGILLYGVSVMSSGLEKVAGGKVRKVINKFSKNRFQSFGLGLVTTFLLQSSTASSIMFVGFASSGIIVLAQAIAMIIGSNVGTTLTAVLLSFKSINAVEILSVFVLVGVIVKIFGKKKTTKEIGSVLIGLGLLFAGMLLIDEATAIFQNIEGFTTFVQAVTSPVLLCLIGIVMTILTQSSLGTMAILISLASMGGAYSVMSLESVAFVVYGANIGTCATALIVSLNSNADGKRVALFHLLFNIFGTLVFGLLHIFHWTDLLLSLQPSVAIILINIIFNLATAILLLPWTNSITKILDKMFLKHKTDQNVFALSSNEAEIPTLAIKSINQGMINGFDKLKQWILDFQNYLNKITLQQHEGLKKQLENLSVYSQSIKDNSIKISTGGLSEQDVKGLNVLLEVCQNYERVVHNLTEIVDSTILDSKPVPFTKTQIEVMQNLCDETVNITNAFRQIYFNIFNENFSFNFDEIVEGVMQCTNFITEVKNNQKKRIVMQLQKSNGKEKYSSFLNITNQFDEIGNDFNDINVNLAELFNKGEAVV